MLFVQSIRNSWRNKKPPTHQGGGFNPPAETYLVSFPTTHRQRLSSPIKGTLALPLPGCQTRIRVVPDVDSERIELASGCNKILCHSQRFIELFSAKRTPRTVNPRPAQAWQASVAELLPDSFSVVGLPYGSLRFGQNVMS
jgi:hypothetical protein